MASGLTTAARADEKSKPAQAPRGSNLDIVAALKKVPGCIGVETAQATGGKRLVFAWFENKRAVLKWYYSDAHQQAMHSAFPDYDIRKPMQGIDENAGPILAIASITYAAKSHFKETAMPISQIAIELYQPLPGGVSLGGTFSPAALKVPGHRVVTPSK
jgi:hypothetical protein